MTGANKELDSCHDPEDKKEPLLCWLGVWEGGLRQ